MPNPPIHIDAEYKDRAVTLHYKRYLCIQRVATGALLGAYLTPLGARQLIDALEPFAAPRAAPVLPPIDVAEVLDALLSRPQQRQYVIEFQHGSDGWRRSRLYGLAGREFSTVAAANERLRAVLDRPLGPRTIRYRVVPVDA